MGRSTLQRFSKAAWWTWLIAVSALCGCQFNPYADWFVTKDVTEKQLVGSYHVTDETVKHCATTEMPFLDGRHLPLSRDARITLTSDHKISVSQVPIDLGGPRACMLTASGTWKVSKHQEYTSVHINLAHPQASAPGCPEGEFGFDLELFDDSALPKHSATRYPLLHLTIGDPDSGDALQFERD